MDRKWQMADACEYTLLKEHAKGNRNNMTEAESVFWSVVKSCGFGEKCRRQYIIGTYIVDFFFRRSMLVVEIDGGYHSTVQQQAEDAIRQDYLEKRGCSVLRFTNEDILCDINNVIETIKQHLTTVPFRSSPF